MKIRPHVSVLVVLALVLSVGGIVHAQETFDGLYIGDMSGTPAAFWAVQSGGVFAGAILFLGLPDPDWQIIIGSFDERKGRGTGQILNSQLVNVGTIDYTIAGGRKGSFTTSLGTAGSFTLIFPEEPPSPGQR